MTISVIAGDAATTTACALAATWPASRDVVVVELDPTGGSLAGWLGLPPTPSLSTLAATARRTRADQHAWAAVESSVRGTAAGLSLLTAPVRATEARRAVEEVTARLLDLLAASPVDLIIDVGRADAAHIGLLADIADHVVLAHRQDVRSVGAASVRVERLVETAEQLAAHPRIAVPDVEPERLSDRPGTRAAAGLSSPDHRAAHRHSAADARSSRHDAATLDARLVVAIIGNAPFPASEVIELVAARLDAPLAGAHLADDQLTAAVLAGRAGVSERRLRRLPLMRSAASLASRLAGPAPATETPAAHADATDPEHDTGDDTGDRPVDMTVDQTVDVTVDDTLADSKAPELATATGAVHEGGELR